MRNHQKHDAHHKSDNDDNEQAAHNLDSPDTHYMRGDSTMSDLTALNSRKVCRVPICTGTLQIPCGRTETVRTYFGSSEHEVREDRGGTVLFVRTTAR